ncbi:MAG: Hpt domain-containing protein [Gemmatimonadota bacterium]
MTDSEPVDPAALERLRAWGGEKLLKEILHLFLANAPQRMDQIRNGVVGSDAEEVERGAHSLKSTAANVGAMQVSLLSTEFGSTASGAGFRSWKRPTPRRSGLCKR